jgi:hypothetical protein
MPYAFADDSFGMSELAEQQHMSVLAAIICLISILRNMTIIPQRPQSHSNGYTAGSIHSMEGAFLKLDTAVAAAAAAAGAAALCVCACAAC